MLQSALFNGVTDYVTALFRYVMFDAQAHYTGVSGVRLDPELLEGGQLLMMKVAR